jgi:putative glutamine amidotransferase
VPIPVIGLTTYNNKNKYGYPIAALMHQYILAVSEAGGAPALIPSGLTEEAGRTLLERLDGILFPGGGDIAIELFGGQPHSRLMDLDPARDALELGMAKAAAEEGLPFLGICRGFQVVNVALGGTLYTDIAEQMPGALKHDYDSGTQREFLAHEVKVEKGRRLAGILGATVLPVNSLHHQGAKDIPAALKPAAHAPDGLVEAIELTGHPFGIAVQWHPEWLMGQVAAQRLFKSFVEACEQNVKGKK